jgi:threonine/homoserine/homoserine lactone efflux protein
MPIAEHLALFSLALFTGFSGAMMPGPMFVATVREACRGGPAAGPRVVGGHAAVEALLVGALAAGAGAALARPEVLFWISRLGGAVLLVFGLLTLRDARAAAATLAHPDAAGPARATHPFWAGVVTTVGNPYFYLWWSSVGLRLGADAERLGRAGYATFFAGHILADLAWYALVAWAVARGRRLASPRVLTGVIALCGLGLAALGLSFWWFAPTGG